MFSLIMSYDDADWQVEAGVEREAAFPLGRFLEYTEAAIAARFEPVSDTALALLVEHPAVFMSELRRDPSDSAAEIVTVRAGRLLRVKVTGSELRYSFVLDRDFGDVPISAPRSFETALGLGRLEIHRTHWALKDGDLVDSLRQAGILEAGEGFAPPAATAPQAVPAEAGPPTKVVESLEDYVTHILALEPPEGHEVFYRGHSDVSYRLEPSLFRRTVQGEYRYLQNEARMALEALSAHPAAFESDLYTLDRLVRMQHFGLPTRLLDVTSNPLVALYFCCSTARFDDDGRETDGEVVVMTTKASEVRFYESDLVSCIANLCMLDDDIKNRLDTSLPLEAFGELPECGKLLHVIRREKPYFTSRIVPRDLERIVFVRGRSTHERITSQSGAFLLFGKDAILPETGHSSLDVRRVVVRRKGEILRQLAKLNIRSSTIYPGLEKTIAEISERYDVARG